MAESHYIIVRADNPADLENMVNEKLAEGYEIVGGIHCMCHNWPREHLPMVVAQAMIKKGVKNGK